MQVNSNLNEQVFREFEGLYQGIVMTNHLYDELIERINTTDKNDSHRQEINDIFCDEWKRIRNKIDEHKTLPNNSSVIAGTEINAFATEKDILSKHVHINTISKKYSIAKIYYRAEDNYENLEPRSSFPYFGMSLILILTFNSRSFEVEIAKSKQGCDKLIPYQLDIKNLTIANPRKEIKFESPEKFGDIIIFCERVIKGVNIELNRLGLEQLERNLEICD